jgi:TPR repeat protein
MGTIAEGASGAGENPGRNWQRGATRRAILDAARLIAARQNSTDFSLNTVAKEAGYSTTTTIFAYFQTKSELLNAIVADDLATFARQMRDSYSFTTPAKEPQALAEEHSPADAPSPSPEVAEEETAQSNTPVEASTVIAFALPDPKQESIADDRAKQAPRVDAWLERRLRVFEKTLADVETRLVTAQADSAKALAVAEESTRIFGERLDTSEKRATELSADLTTRLSAAEKRLRENHGELRNSLLNISMRIDSLEKAAHSISAGAGYVPPALEETRQPLAESSPEDKPLTAAAETYLSAARRAAQAAAALSQIDAAPKAKVRSFWFNRESAIVGACIAFVFIFGAVIAFALGEHVGRAAPVRIIAARHAELKLPLASLDRLSALAKAGDPQAELLIGLRYLKGQSVAVNAPVAAKWIRKAAAHDPVAQYWMGRITEQGEGVSADAAEALRWYQAAAASGNRDAMYNLGVASAEGLGTQRDFAQSALWFTKAASLGVTNAQFNLAVLYERGEGVVQSLPDAYKWYAIAAVNGDSESLQRADAIATQLSHPRSMRRNVSPRRSNRLHLMARRTFSRATGAPRSQHSDQSFLGNFTDSRISRLFSSIAPMIAAVSVPDESSLASWSTRSRR